MATMTHYRLFGGDDTNTVNLDQTNFFIQNSGASYAIEQIGPNALQFQVEAGDVWSGDPRTKNRSEIASSEVIPDGTPINVSYVMNIQPGAANTAAWCVLGQFHQDIGSGSPPFEINMDGEKMQVVIGYPGAGGTTNYLTLFSDTANIARGQNYAMNINVTFAPNGAGHLVVTRDGITIVNYTGPLGDAGQTSVYWKEGIYRDASTTTEAVDYSNLSVTTGSPHANTSSNTQVFNTYDNTGSILSTTSNVFDANGNLVKSTVVSAGGGSQISTYAVTGQPYTSIVQNYSASGQLVGQIEYSSNGAKLYQMSSTAGVVSTWTYNATGAVVTSTVTDATGSETIYNYAAVGGALIEYQTYNAAKQLTENETFGAGQSKTIYMYQIAGQAYTSSVTQYNSSGQLVLLKQYNTNNTMHYESVIDSSGVTTNTSYDGNGLLMSSNVITPNVGNVVSTYNITGQPFVSSVAQYGVTGALVSLSEYNANNTLYYKSITAASGVVTNTRYDGNGHILNTNAINLDGSHVLTSYNAGSTSISCLQDYNSANAMTLNETFSSDGSYVIQHFGVTNQPYASDSIHYNGSGAVTSDTEYEANGNKYYNYSVDSNGCATRNYYDATGKLMESTSITTGGATTDAAYEAKVTLTSDGNNDTMQSFNTDTFVFKSHFGSDTISGFNAGNGATHDTIQISPSLAASFANLTMHQAGANVVIGATASDFITLTHVTLASLTAGDFVFRG